MAYEDFNEHNGYFEVEEVSGWEEATLEVRDGEAVIAWNRSDKEWQQVNWQQKQAGFPDDDMCALGQIADCSANLDIFYASQFVQNECHTHTATTVSRRVPHQFEYNPILNGTICGTIYFDVVPVQTFSENYGGAVTLVNIGKPNVYAEKVGVNHTTGEVEVIWNDLVEFKRTKLVVSYEYHMDPLPAKYKPFNPITENQVKIE
jgi:hypothetical protein